MQHINVENVDMKANRIVFRKIKQQYDLLVMKSAYVLAEMDLQYDENFKQEPHFMMDPETFAKTHIPVVSNETRISSLMHQIKALEELRSSLLDEEKYLKVREAEELLIKLKKELKRINNGI